MREFLSITLPSLRQEIGVCVTVTVIAALSAFDIVYISTSGGPGNATMVPGLEIYQLAFFNREVGLASALAVVLMVLVLVCVLPIQWLTRQRRATRDRRSPEHVARAGALLVVLMAVTLLPFASLFTTALHQSGTYPNGLDWPSHPHWGNFVEAFQAANMGTIFKSSVLIVLGVVPVSVVDRDDGRLRARPAARSPAAGSSSCSSCSA